MPLTMGDFLARELAWSTRSWALLDLREVGEYNRGHIPSATSLPRRMLEFRISEILPDLSWPVVVYDNGTGDQRAELGAARLVEMGLAHVSVLSGGIAAWTEAGQDLATGSNVPSKAFGETILHSDSIRNVTPKDLFELCEGGHELAVCDVRTTGEYALHHLPGAGSFPGFELAAQLPRLVKTHEYVVLNCAGRTRSIIATATAQALGFDCLALENGTMGWRLAGYEVECGEADVVPLPRPRDKAAVAARARDLAVELGVVPITAETLKAMRCAENCERPYVIDVRSRVAFLAGHIEGAIWLPGGQLIQRTDDYLAVPGAPIVVVDDGDARSWLAAWWLKRMRFPTVCVLRLGMQAWRDVGLNVKTGRGHTRPALLDSLVDRFPTLGIEALKNRLAQTPPPIIIDVSTSKAFAKGRLSGAIWISRGWLETEISNHAGLDDEVVLTASDPAHAFLAAESLSKLGYGRISVFASTPSAWAEAGGLVQTGAVSETPDDIIEPPYEKGVQAMRDYLEWEIRLTAGKDASEQGATLVEKE